MFLGRAWQHLRWDAPFRSLLWDQSLMEPVFNVVGITWQTYVQYSDVYIQLLIQGFGVFYLICAILVWIATVERKWVGKVLIVGSIALFSLALLYWKSKFYFFGQLIEYSCQFATPVALYYAIYHQKNTSNYRLFLKTIIALTFIGHGLFAIGYYPVPASFQTMMLNFFGGHEIYVKNLLYFAGILDFVIAIGLFIPYLQYPSLIWAVIWGGATALARLITNFYPHIPWQSVDQWLFEVLYRVPHAGIPLVVLALIIAHKKKVAQTS